jgi:hypothetical protein
MQHGRKGATQLLDSDAHRGELRVDAQRRLEDQPGGKWIAVAQADLDKAGLILRCSD